MGDFAQPAVMGLLASGTVSSAVGSYRQGEAAARAAEFNELMIRRETDQRISQALSESRRREATNRTRIAKSGVRPEGTALAVLDANEYEDHRQRMFIKYSGDAGAATARSQGRNARASARMGIASDVIGGAGRIGALAIRNA